MKATDRPELSSNAREQLQESKPTKQANSRPPITKSTRDVEKQQVSFDEEFMQKLDSFSFLDLRVFDVEKISSS